MTLITQFFANCPKCGRAPSDSYKHACCPGVHRYDRCSNRIHDEADLGPAALFVLQMIADRYRDGIKLTDDLIEEVNELLSLGKKKQ